MPSATIAFVNNSTRHPGILLQTCTRSRTSGVSALVQGCLGRACLPILLCICTSRPARLPVKPRPVRIDLTHPVIRPAGNSTFPMVPGHEIVGIVTEVGSNVTDFKVKSRLAASVAMQSAGGYTTALLPADCCPANVALLPYKRCPTALQPLPVTQPSCSPPPPCCPGGRARRHRLPDRQLRQVRAVRGV